MTRLTWRLIMACFLVLVLTILPMPQFLNGIRPPWVLLLVLYLQFYLPNSFQIVVMFIMGLIMDVLLSSVMGEHAFALSLIVWLASSKARRFSFFTIGQQMALIGLFSFLYLLVILLINASLGYHVSWGSVTGSVILSVALWPWVRLVAEDMLPAKKQYPHRALYP